MVLAKKIVRGHSRHNRNASRQTAKAAGLLSFRGAGLARAQINEISGKKARKTKKKATQKTHENHFLLKIRTWSITGPLGSTQHRERRPACRKKTSHRETKRASNGM